jgi:IclR family acetate operon transcriptional repressor
MTAILAFLPQEEIDRILSKARTPRLTPWSIVKPDQIRKKIVEVRARGYAVGIRERTPTTNAVAAPVFDSQGVIATLAIVAPAERLTRKACEQMGPIVRDLALRLSEEMGFQALGRSFRLPSRQTAGT